MYKEFAPGPLLEHHSFTLLNPDSETYSPSSSSEHSSMSFIHLTSTWKRKKGEGITMAREGTPFNFRELFQVDVRWIKDIEECSEEELGEYVSEAGFKSVNEWCSRRGPGAKSLYLVSKT